MHTGVTSVAPSTAVKSIAKQMQDQDIGAIPVSENGKLVGIVTDRDIVCRALAQGQSPQAATARDVMSGNVVCCKADDDVERAVRLMEEKHVRRLPVVDGKQQMVGMLSLGDVSARMPLDLGGELLRSVSAHHS
jgi:CBS domain-containing protein